MITSKKRRGWIVSLFVVLCTAAALQISTYSKEDYEAVVFVSKNKIVCKVGRLEDRGRRSLVGVDGTILSIARGDTEKEVLAKIHADTLNVECER